MSRTPNYILKALDKDYEKKGKIGAAWDNEDSTITIVLDPFVYISGRDNLVLTLFRKKEETEVI